MSYKYSAILSPVFGLLLPLSAVSAADLEKGVLATVDGNPITQGAVATVADQLSSAGQAPNFDSILEELINMEVLTRAAEEIEMDSLPDVADAIRLQYTQTMANAYLARISAELTFTDDDLRAEYALQSASVERAEYELSHILVQNAETAADVLADVAKDKDFALLADLYSIDPTGQTGGGLGWMQSSTLPPEFMEVVPSLNAGDVADKAVETEYGFHIIKLTDKRETALPEFEAVKDGLADLVKRKALALHLENLRAKSTIQTR